jgi:hypothetical protein
MGELIPIVLFLCVAAVLILRPITRRLGMLIEQVVRERQAPAASIADVRAMHAAVEQLGARLERMEERLDFTERLISSQQAPPRLMADRPLHADARPER